MGDTPSFLDVELTETVANDLARDEDVGIIHQGDLFWVSTYASKHVSEKEYLSYSPYSAGPFETQQDAEAWLTWAILQAS